MGATLSALRDKYLTSKEPRTLLLGLDGAGKTYFFYKLSPPEDYPRSHTCGFDVMRAKYKEMHFISWNLGGQRIRPYQRPYFEGINSIIFMVDSNDYERIQDAKEELDRLLAEEELKGAPLLIYANKQDLKGMSIDEVTEKLKLKEITGRDWSIIGSSMVTGDGLYEGLEWLIKTVKKK